ncbi:NDR1/HIN1-like protein 12 [Salvia miltiorrhiza]|uniref:NDR1/HIN1-like protein 12 n=1 Tax=Salvia miltiorrhiza TaxID=226208 RepID=UPI0025AD354C|nr:NDR1/HIN1-like protein 12 [Salvia miltiorrhiza]
MLMAEEEPPHPYPHPHPHPNPHPHPHSHPNPHPHAHPQPPKMASPDEKHPHKEPIPPPYPRPRGRGYSGGGGRARDPRRALCTAAAAVLVLVGVTALTLWLVYRPRHPRFQVVSAAVYQLNTSSPPFVTASAQFTVVARNPNRHLTVLYDPFSAYLSYRNRAITPPAALPPLFQETRSTVALSPLLGGAPVPVEAELANALAMDEAYGVVGLRLVLTGKVRYKAGAVGGGRHGVYVACDLLVSLKKGFVGQLPLLGSPPCKVHL